MGSTSSLTRSSIDWSLWRRWVVANAVGEGVGLGGSFLVGAGLGAVLQGQHGAWVEIGLALVAVALGTLCEGVIVGHAQWRVLRRALPGLSRGSWVRATAVGAGVAWLLGMIPSTVMSLVSGPARPPVVAVAGEAASASEPGALVMYLAAAGMGWCWGRSWRARSTWCCAATSRARAGGSRATRRRGRWPCR